MKKRNAKISYTGKDVFVGIDVHKKTYSVVARVEGEVVKKWTTKASPEDLSQQFHSVLCEIGLGCVSPYPPNICPEPMDTIDMTPPTEIVLFPNPAYTSFQIRGDLTGLDDKLQVYNTQGKLCFETKNFHPETTISISMLPKGVYLIVLTGPLGSKSINLLVEPE